jgi:hypothetical protein
MDTAAAVARSIVERARNRLVSSRSSIASRNRTRGMMEMATNPMRSTPRTDAKNVHDLDGEARTIWSTLLSDAGDMERTHPGITTLMAKSLGATGFDFVGRSILVLVGDRRLPLDRWLGATGRSYTGRVASSLENDLSRILRYVSTRPAPDPTHPEIEAPEAPAP